ncbi:hypothetical protein ACGFNU_35070 [Spirillospora sp. NPDC048911]|uniref:hypothetical protein n=1 Tax=Spirillospora sp. NPDC048911 TaxID=3364527 RepID=UPI00371F56AF
MLACLCGTAKEDDSPTSDATGLLKRGSNLVGLVCGLGKADEDDSAAPETDRLMRAGVGASSSPNATGHSHEGSPIAGGCHPRPQGPDDILMKNDHGWI